MNGKDGKPFKTRAGGTIKFEEVIGLVTEAAQKRLDENTSLRGALNATRQSQTDPHLAEKIGIAALKFADLSNNVRKDYIFDIDKFTSFEGKTGPYILYTIARINSLFKKAGTVIPSATDIQARGISDTRKILAKVLTLADSYTAAAANYTLNGIVDTTFALASEFNLFYANTKILSEPDEGKKQNYLALCEVVRIALTAAMHTLAIETVEEM